MNLQEQLDQVHNNFLKNAPEAATELDADTDALVKGGVGQDGPKVGDLAPEFELPDQLGRTVGSKDLLTGGPLVITFYRGTW